MNNADFWKSVSDIIAEGFTPEGLHILDQREVRHMSLHPYSREQKIRQIQSIRHLSTTSKEIANAERSKKNI